MKKPSEDKRAPSKTSNAALAARQNGGSSIPSHPSMTNLRSSEYSSKKSGSNDVARPDLLTGPSRLEPLVTPTRPRSQKAHSLPPLQTKPEVETQIDIEALQREAREPSSAETSDNEDQRTQGGQHNDQE